MSKEPLVSAIIIFLNGEDFLQEAIESVLAQSYDHWELLLVDDGSTDESTEIAVRYAEQHPDEIRYLEHDGHQNRGKNASRNLGLHYANGEYIALLDHDDVWLPNKLEDQVRILESLPEAGMMYGRTRYWHSWTGRPEDRERDGFTTLGIKPNTLVRPPHLVTLFLRDEGTIAATCSMLIRREVAERVGGFEESFRDIYEDTLFLAKIYLEAPVFVAGECWDYYRQHPNNSFYSALQTGRWHPARPNLAREMFLNRVEQYISERGINDAELREALRAELRPYRDPEARTPLQKYHDVCWDAGVALVRGEDPSPLVRALDEVPSPALDGHTLAEWIFNMVPFLICRAPSVWVELWPRLEQRIEEFFTAVEVQAHVGSLAAEALSVLMFLIKGWFFRVEEGNVAKLRFPLDGSDTVRIAIEKANTKPTFDIQLNQPRLEARSKHQYVINFMARADSPRSICVGFAKARAPWSNLGLYSKIDLTTEWQSFREVFVATEDDDNARIHFDVGDSEIPVELSSVSLQSLPNDLCIEPSLSPAVEKERSEVSSGVGWK